MNRKIIALAAASGLFFVGAYAWAQGGPMPWGQQSDMMAWETFAQIAAPSGNPITTNVEFETWATDQDIYNPTPHWPLVNAPKVLHPSVLRASKLQHGINAQVISPDECGPPGDPAAAKAAGFPKGACIGEEVRRNWASFQYIVSNSLYTKAGLTQAFAKKLVVDLPADSVEFKGDWVKVADLMAWVHIDAKRLHEIYYTNTATSAGVTTEFALVAFHFSTKQQKNWVWADFEHEMNPGRCDDIGCRDAFGAVVPVVSPKTTPYQSYGACLKTPAVQSMFDNAGLPAVWQHYCLKGSQMSFTGTDGKASLLGNSVIEGIAAGVPVSQSSCISCHAYASFDKSGSTNPALNSNPVGPVDPAKMNGYAGADFIWGVLFTK